MKRLVLAFLPALPILFFLLRFSTLPIAVLAVAIWFTIALFLLFVLPPWRKRLANKETESYRFYVYLLVICVMSIVIAIFLFQKFSEEPPADPLKNSNSPIVISSLNPSADRIATAGPEPMIRYWDVATGNSSNEKPTSDDMLYANYSDSFSAVAFSPDDSILAIGSNDKTIRLWSYRQNVLTRQLIGHLGGIRVLVFSPDGTYLASGSDDKTVRIWRMSDGVQIKSLDGPSKPVTCLAFSPDSQTLVAGSADGTIRIWKTSDGSFVKLIGHSESVSGLSFTADGQTLFSLSEKHDLRKWRTSDWNVQILTSTIRDTVSAVAFARDNSSFITGDSNNTVRQWDITTDKITREITILSEPVTALAYDSANNRVVIGSREKKLKVATVSNGKISREQELGFEVNALAMNRDGSLYAVVTADKSVRIMKTNDGTVAFRYQGVTQETTLMTYNKDSSSLITVSRDGYVRFWRPMKDGKKDGSLIYELYLNNGALTSIASHPSDENIVALGNDKGNVVVWNAVDDGLQYTAVYTQPTTITALAYSPDGKWIAAGSERMIRVVNLEDTNQATTFNHSGGSITKLSFTPDGKTLISASQHGMIMLWNPNDAVAKPTILPTQSSPVGALWVSKNSSTLMVGNENGFFQTWDLNNNWWYDSFNRFDMPIQHIDVNGKNQVVALGASRTGTQMQSWVVGNMDDIQGRLNLYWLERIFVPTEILRLFWASVLGLIASIAFVILVVLVPSWASARSLYSQYPGYTFGQALKAVFSIELGIHRAQILISKGKSNKQSDAVGALSELAGPGMLIVEEGNAGVLMRHGDITRVVGNGITWLRPYEFVHMAVDLSLKVEKVIVDNPLTLDKMMLKSLIFLIFFRVDRGDQGQSSGPQYPFDEKIIKEKIWTPKSTDWAGPVISISQGHARDIIAQYRFEDIIAITGDARKQFITDLIDRIKLQMRNLGVDVIGGSLVNIEISDQARIALEHKGLSEVARQANLIAAEGEKESIARKGEGEAMRMRRIEQQIAEFLHSATGKDLDAKTATQILETVQYLLALDKISSAEGPKTFVIGDTKGFSGSVESASPKTPGSGSPTGPAASGAGSTGGPAAPSTPATP